MYLTRIVLANSEKLFVYLQIHSTWDSYDALNEISGSIKFEKIFA